MHAKYWESFFDHLIFVQHLGSITYMGTDKIAEADFNDLVVKSVKNVEIYDEEIKIIGLVFQKK